MPSEEESIGERECFENGKLGKLIKKSRVRSKATMISAVICVLILLLPSIIVAYPPFWDDVYVDQLPYYHEWDDGPYDVTLYVKNVTENMTLSITFRKSSEIPESVLYVDDESYGSIEVGVTIFSVPISSNVTLTFSASLMNITIVRVGDYGIINNTYDDVIVKGKTYAEEYQRLNITSGQDEGYRAVVSIPINNWHSLTVYPIQDTDLNFMAITERGISNFSVVTDEPAQSVLAASVKGVKISTNLSEHFSFKVNYTDPCPAPIVTRYPDFYPDLFVSPNDIIFSNDTPDQGDVIWINVSVHNIGEMDVYDFNVTAYLDIVCNTTVIGKDNTSLGKGASTTVSFEWNTTDVYGDHIIRILLDEDNLIEESNESNHASKHVFVDDSLVNEDYDLDGLPNFWENKYGLDPCNGSGDNGRHGDPDNDSYENIQEYENITHPKNPDTDSDGLLDGINNSLIELELKNITRKNIQPPPPPPPSDYYIMMSEYEIATGQKFPYVGYRVPTNNSSYWSLGPGETVYPNEILSIAFMVEEMPLNLYDRNLSIPVSKFTITVDKDQLQINKTENITLDDLEFTLVVEATLLEYSFNDPDPLCKDSDWDGLNDTSEIDYLSSRILDFRSVDTDNDGVKNYLDVDSDNDNATDGIELEVYRHPEHAVPQLYRAIQELPEITDPLNPDTEDDGLLDGDEMFKYHTDPLSCDTDYDSLDDYYEVKTWFFYSNVTLEQAAFYDNKCRTTINIENYEQGEYRANISSTIQLKIEDEENISKALNITLRSSSKNTTIPYELVGDPQVGGEGVTKVNVTYSFEFENNGDAVEILITSNGSIFHRITHFRAFLNYTIFERLGTNPLDGDTDSDGLPDAEEISIGLSPANRDTDSDHFWDGAELEYWDVVHKLRIEERLERAKIPDFDGDKVPDGDEVIFGIDPLDADPDNDEIGDYEELYQYVPMWRDELSQIFIGYCNESGSYKHGSLCQYFEIKERDSYMLKFVSLDTINRTLNHYNSSLLNDHDYLALVNNEFMNQSSIINVTRDGLLLDLDFGTDSMVVNKTIYGNYINITERRYFTVTARLGPSDTNYSISYDINVTEENATVVLNFNQFVPSRQGLHPFKVDIDGDELPDGVEAKIGSNPWERHSDDDEINDFHEYNGTYGYKTNPAKEDTDGDGLWDGYNISGEGVVGELSLGTNSTNVDTDGDTLWDGYNISTHIGELSVNTDPLKADTDNDTMPDDWEVKYCLQPRNASDANDDADNDNLLNAQEYTVDTIPRDNDTDDDGLFDGDEILGVLFRTNIINGAISIENYGAQEGYKWIFYNGTDWKKYEYSNNSVETETQVTSNGSSQINPAIYGDLIVWQDDRNSSAGWDIYLYNLSSDEETRITINVSNQTNPAIFGNYIVWQDDRNSSSGWDIYLYNISSGNETRITVNESDQKYPSIYGDIIIWADERDSNSTNGWQKEIYMYNIKNEVEIRVTNDTIEDDPEALLPNQTYPWIYESSVVWLDDKYNGSNVYLHQASGGKYLTNDSFEQKNPRMYENIVVWEDYRNGNADIYMYDVLKDNITQITTNASNQTNPYVYGDNILWEDYRNGKADIYLYNITTSTTIQLTNNSENQTAPVAYIDRFVWVDDRNGNQDIYMYNFTHLVTLQDNSPIYYNNDNNEIYVWKANARYYIFNETSNAAVNTHYRPLNGYRYRELYEGPSPFDPDSDADGVYDGQEPYWNQDNDTDSIINALDTDSDGDGVPDGREVRLGYRTNADEGKYDAESWVAIDINVSDEIYVLKGFWYNASANDTNMGSYNFTLIKSLTTPEGKNVSYNSTSEFIRIGFAPNASYFAANDSVAIKTENYGQASYTANRQETTFAVDYSVDDDSTPNILDNDSDDDGILDGTEPLWYQDLDNDGYENMVDKDSDGDGIEDGTEDWNYNGVVDDNETSMIDVDTDHDGIWDSEEPDWNLDTDGDGLINAVDIDSDGDGVMDSNEIRIVYRTNALKGQFNSSSWVAVALPHDGLDPWENDTYPPYGHELTGFSYDTVVGSPSGDVIGETPEGETIYYDDTHIYITNIRFELNETNSDIDNSTIPTLAFSSKKQEVIIFFNVTYDGSKNILNNDSDNDGLLDGLEDQNGNGILDKDETNPWTKDTDGDGISDGTEDKNKNGSWDSNETDPLNPDTDGDGLYDGWQDIDEDGEWDVGVELGEDYDIDGEIDPGETNPTIYDTDGDGLSDGDEVRTSTFWYEAEDHAFEGDQIVTDNDASGGKSLKNRTSSVEVFKITQNLPAQTFKYKLYVKANKTAAVSIGEIELTADKGSTVITHTLQIRGSAYDWYSSDILEFDASNQITIYGNDTGTKPSAYIDKVLLINVTVTEITSLSGGITEIAFDSIDGEDVTVYLEIPENLYVTKAKMDLSGEENAFCSYQATGSSLRSDHTATLLKEGKVLVTGGWFQGATKFYVLDSCLLYDPATNTWEYTDSMENVRYCHTATLLNDGKVLVTGGYFDYDYACLNDSCELYDPAIGQWTTTGSLNKARAEHTATLLNNGKVLVAGGQCQDSYSCELYDPATGQWSIVDSLNTQRWRHTATLLNNGKVLVTGGFNGAYTSSCELYDPATDSWAYTLDSLDTARAYHTATLLSNGKVLVAGGENGYNSDLSSCEIYVPSTGQFTTTGSLNNARSGHTATLLNDGRVLVTGGTGPDQGWPRIVLRSCEFYDPVTGSWAYTASLIHQRITHTATLLDNGTVLLSFGGSVYSELFCFSYPIDSTLDVGNDVDIQWYHNNKFFVTETTPDFADEINEYIFYHRGETNEDGNYLVPLKFHSNFVGKIVFSNMKIILEHRVSDPLDKDTDGDGLDDLVELDIYNTQSINIDSDNDNIPDKVELMINGVGIGTDPADHDTDSDWLWDGFEDLDGDCEYDPLSEVGENIDLDYEVDYNEPHPLDPDSDDDRLLDGIERIPYVLWWEAENYTKNEATQKVEDSDKRASRDYAATSTTSNEIFVEIIQNLPSDTLNYKLYIKARKSGTSDALIEVHKDSSSLDTIEVGEEEYQWYSTTNLEFTASSSITIELKNTTTASTAVYVDKVMLVNISRLYVNSLVEGSTPHSLTFNGEGNKTVNITIPIIGTVPKYVVSAIIGLEGVEYNAHYPTDPYMNLGDNEDYWLHQWGWPGEFKTTSTTLDLAGEINMYISRHINDGPDAISEDGYMRIQLTFYSKTDGIIKITDIDIKLGPYVTDALDNDTDSDWLLDGDEVDIYGTYSLSWDSDNDNLFDVVEPVEGIGTNPTDSDTEDDMFGDGEEVKVIFRADDTSGSFDGYNDNTWVCVPDYMKIDLDEDTFWVPFNPKGNPSRDLIDSATNDTGYYLLYRDGNSWDSVWHLNWSSTHTGSKRVFTGTIESDGTLSIKAEEYPPLDTGEDDVWISNNKIHISGEAGSSDTDDTFTFTVDGGSWLKFDLKIDNNRLYENIFIGVLNAIPPTDPFEYHAGSLVNYGYVGNVSDLPSTAGKIAYNASGDYEMYLNKGNASIYIDTKDGNYSIYERGHPPVPSNDKLSLEPTLPYPLLDLEIYANSALDFDKDNDGIVDGLDPDPSDADIDNDGLLDGFEYYVLGSGLNNGDTDGDGLKDGTECGITLNDVFTVYWNVDLNILIYGTDINSDNFVPDLDPKSRTSPTKKDTDGDGLWDGIDTALGKGEDINKNGKIDLDGEGYLMETDPNDRDTDWDGLIDGIECGIEGFDGDTSTTTDPLDMDSDDDGIVDGMEDKNHNGTVDLNETDPNDTDTDKDLLWDGLEIGKNLTNIKMPRSGINGTDTSSGKFGTHYDHDTSTTTNPITNDTDDDGIPDGWIDGWTYSRTEGWHEDENAVNCNDSKEIWEGEDLDLDGAYEPNLDFRYEIDPAKKDTDGDGIPDGVEFILFAQYLDDSLGLNPLNASDAYGDLDNDTLINLEEYEQAVDSDDIDIDADNDDLINFYDNNDDNNGADMDDPWLTVWEVMWGLDPYFDEYDDQYDFDNDGLSNKFEWDNRTYINLTIADSDGDGLEDGWEFAYWDITRNQTEYWALVNCSKYDSDEDGVSDGQEINGYNVTISWYEGEDLKSKDIKVYGDPMGAYMDPNGNYLDVDGDGIFDIDEVDPWNSTNLDWYFEVLKYDPRPQSEKDEQVQNQFNAFIKETIPPKIENVDIKTDCKTKWDTSYIVPILIVEHCWSKIKVEISDVSEFTVTIKVKDNGKYETFTGKGNEEFEAIIDIDYYMDYCLDYKVKVTATDVAGNKIEWEKEIDGLFGGLLDALTAIWDAIAGAFEAAFELMLAALSFLVDLILNGIKAIIDGLFAPIRNAFNTWQSGIFSTVDRIMTVGDVDDIDVNLLYETMLVGTFVTIVYVLAAALIYIIEPLIWAVLNIVPGLGLVSTIIGEALIQGLVAGLNKLAITVAMSTGLVMFGEVLAAIIPHDDPVHNVVTATGTSFLAIVAIPVQKHLAGKGLSKRDALGFGLIVIGYFMSLAAASIWEEYSHELAVFGAVVAGIGLVISLASPDMPKPVGLIDEGIGSVLAGMAAYYALCG